MIYICAHLEYLGFFLWPNPFEYKVKDLRAIFCLLIGQLLLTLCFFKKRS